MILKNIYNKGHYMNNSEFEKLFSYGTLQDENVQLQLFNRRLDGSDDYIIGYQLSTIEIKDPDVIAKSGTAFHPMLKYTGNNFDKVPGKVFTITQNELKQADSYEVSDYERILVQLFSGITAWVYTFRDLNVSEKMNASVMKV